MSQRGVSKIDGSGPTRTLLPPYAVFGCAAVFYWSISSRAMIYTVMPTIAADLNLTGSSGGLAISTMLFGYCSASWAAGYLPGRRKARVLGGILLSLPGVAGVALSQHFWTLLFSAFVAGFGVGVYFPLGLSIIVDVGNQRNRANFMAIHEFAATMASFSGSAAVAVLLLWTDWRGGLLGWCLVGLLSLGLFSLVTDPERGRTAHRSSQSTRIPFNLTLLYCVLAQGAISTQLMGIISMLPLIMVKAWGIEQTAAAATVGYTRLAGLVGVAVTALVAARWGNRLLIRRMQLLSLVGSALMFTVGYGPLFVIGMMMVAVGAGGAVVVLPLLFASAYPAHLQDQALAVSGGVGGFIGMVLAPTVFGVMLDASVPKLPLLTVCLAAGAAVLLIGLIPDHREEPPFTPIAVPEQSKSL